MSPFVEKRYHIFEVAEREGVDVSAVLDWCKRGLRNTPNLADGSTEISASDLREFLDSRRQADVMPTTEADESDRLMAIAEYAEWCDIEPRHVEEWISEGLPVHEREGKRFIDKDEVYAFVRAKNDKLEDEPTRKTQSSGNAEVASERTMEDGSVLVAEEFDYGFFG